MKAPDRMNAPQKLVSELHLARLRLTKAEGQFATAKEMARVARRRRKEARQAARRAKKQARLAKQEVLEAKLVLAKAEENLARDSRRAPETKSAARAARKKTAAPRPKTSAAPAASRSPKPVAARRANRRPGRSKAPIRRKPRSASAPAVVSRDLESPVEQMPIATEPATDPIVKTAAELSAGTAAADRPVEPKPMDDQSG